MHVPNYHLKYYNSANRIFSPELHRFVTVSVQANPRPTLYVWIKLWQMEMDMLNVTGENSVLLLSLLINKQK